MFFCFGLHCTDHGPKTKKLSVRNLDDLMILVTVKMVQEVSSIGNSKMKVWVKVPNHMKTNLCLLSKLFLDLLLLQPWLEHNSKSCTRAELCEELTTI
jgi:hypothetical protein